MDIQLLSRVLWRFRGLMIVGLVVAAGLAVLSVANISFVGGKPKLEYRQAEKWTTHSVILVTQTGFPIGRSVSTSTLPVDANNPKAGSVPRYAAPAALAGYAVLYAELAVSDPVQAIMRRSGPILGTYSASAVTSAANAGNALPLIRIDAVASSREGAKLTVSHATAALIRYIRNQQDAAHISRATRVVLAPIERADRPELLKGRSLARPVAAFVVLLALFTGLAFALENLRPSADRRLELTSKPKEDSPPGAAPIRYSA